MSKSRLFVVAALVVACGAPPQKFTFKHAERRGRLSNGLRFVLMPDASTRLVQVDVRYDVGQREDPQGKAGLAHLVEHLNFDQRPDGPDQPNLWLYTEQIDLWRNAFTNWDSTHYQNNGRAEAMDAMLKVEAMRLFYGCKTITNDEFLREREVVRQEIRQRNPGAEGQIPQLVLSAIYPKGHAYERMIGGDDKQLASMELDDACKFMHDYYTPSNATIVIAGGFDPDKAWESINKWFGKLEKRDPMPRTPVEQFTVQRDQKQFDLDVERPAVLVGWALPPANTPEGEAAEFGIWNAFFRTAAKGEEYGFATSVQPYTLGGELAPAFVIQINLKSMSDVDEALDFVNKAAKQAYRGFDEGTYEDLQEAKSLRKADFIKQLEPLEARTIAVGDLVQFSKEVNFDSHELYVFHELDKIEKYDGARISAAVKKALDPSKARIVVIKNNKEGIKGDTRAAFTLQTKTDDQKSAPLVDPSEARKVLDVGKLTSFDGAQRFTLDNGMKAVVLPVHAMPLASAFLVFHNTGAANTPDSPGLAQQAANFLALPIDAEAFARTGINVACVATTDESVCHTDGVNIYLDVMLKGLERLVTAGEYNQERIERWQKRVKVQYESKLFQQQSEFRRQIYASVLGADHPYTKTIEITPQSAERIHRDGLDKYRRAHYVASNATLIVVGDVQPAEVEKLIRSVFGSWSKGTQDAPVDKTIAKRVGPVFVGVVGKEQAQLAVRIAYPAPAGIDGQEGARAVLSRMLNIRMEDVREKHGTTYGASAQRRPQVGPAMYVMGATIDAERAGESIAAMREGVEMLRKGEHFDEDFVRARRVLVQDLLGESTVTSQLAQEIATIEKFKLPPSFFNTELQQVAHLSVAQIRALVHNELDPNNEVVVVLGDKPHLEKAFREAGITDVKFVEPDYK